MTQICHICTHSQRLAIDRAIVEGSGLTNIAKKYNVPYHSLYAHSKTHITRQLLKVMETKGFMEGGELLKTIDDIVIKAKDILNRNYDKGRDVIALKAIDSIKGTVQLLANISAQLHAERIAEAQLAKDNGEGDREQEEQKYFESLQVYSMEELKVYQRLTNKRLHKNADIIICDNKVLRPNCNGNKSD